jgi:hypothetical protein
VGMTALDFEQIKQLHARYCQTVDFEDVEGLVGIFAPDGCFDGPEHVWRGEQELREFGAGVADGTQGHVRHSTLSSLIDGDGTTARSLSYAVITRDFGPPLGKGQATHSAVLTTGLYSDDLVKLDGRWVYARRHFRHDGWPDVLGRVREPLEIEHVDAGARAPGDAPGLSALDIEAITQLLARYGYTLDFEDYDGFVGCFTADGSFSAVTRPDMGGSGKSQGSEELYEFAKTVGHWVRGHARHGAISAVIEGDGERAYVSSYSFIPMDYGTPRQPRQRDNATVGTTGIYRDEVVKVDGRWLFSQRTFRYDGWPDVVDMAGEPLEVALFATP